MNQSKACRSCEQILPISSFHASKNHKDGLRPNCKACRALESAQHYLANREHRLSLGKIWVANNRDKVREGQRRRKASTNYQLRWQQDNRAKVREYKQRRKATMLQNETFDISQKELLKLYASPCFYCGGYDQIQMDHVIPVARGGRHSIGNLVPACKSCNSSKRHSFIMEWRIQQSR